MQASSITSSPATAKNQLTINDLDDDSLGMILNKLPLPDRMRIESVCRRWYAVSRTYWCIYSKFLSIDEALVPSYDNTTDEKYKNILEKILQRLGPYLKEIHFSWNDNFSKRLEMGTIAWVVKLCPKLKSLDLGFLKINNDDWLACKNIETLNFSWKSRGAEFDILLRKNRRLRRLAIYNAVSWRASDLDHLVPGQLEFLMIDNCTLFEFTAKFADKLAESLNELYYSTLGNGGHNLEHIGKLKNLRSLSLKGSMERLPTTFIADIARNCRKLECVFLAISAEHAYDPNVFEQLFDLPYLRRLVIIVDENNVPSKNQRDSLLQRAAHLEFFELDTYTCAKCKFNGTILDSCDRHLDSWLA